MYRVRRAVAVHSVPWYTCIHASMRLPRTLAMVMHHAPIRTIQHRNKNYSHGLAQVTEQRPRFAQLDCLIQTRPSRGDEHLGLFGNLSDWVRRVHVPVEAWSLIGVSIVGLRPTAPTTDG